MFVRDALKYVVDAMIAETGSQGLDSDRPTVQEFIRLYEEDPSLVSHEPGYTVRKRLEGINLINFTALAPLTENQKRGIWSQIQTLYEANPISTTPDWSITPNWSVATRIGTLAGHLANI
jgi:hypothetical protein